MTNRLELNWKLDGFVGEQRYYCSETPIDTLSLPTPKAVLAGDVRSYVDTSIEADKAYYVCIGSIRNGTEKLSEQVSIVTSSDAYTAYVVALLHFEDNLIDETGLNFAYTGAAPIFKIGKFGKALGQTYGTTNFVSRTVNLDSGICTIECYFKQTQTSQRSMIFNTYAIGTTVNGSLLAVYSNQILFNSNTSNIISVPYTPDSEFHHIALVLNAGTIKLFLDGVMRGSVSNSAIIGNKKMYIDVDTYNSRNTGLIIDELRITKGVARYTENFTPPAVPFSLN